MSDGFGLACCSAEVLMGGIDLNRIAQAASLDVVNLACRAGGKTILDAIRLSILPGEFVGLLGPSGSGKSTLLKSACGVLKPHSGEIRLDGLNLYDHRDTWRQSIGYVPQDDIIHTELTVGEAVGFAAELRLPPSVSPSERQELVNKTLHSIGLQNRADVRIAKLSGGQRKRASVAVELLTRPRILFLDEPTSGQDPHIESQMMQLFQGIARDGCTTVITTHAMASIESVNLVVLLHGGHLVFVGPPTTLLDYFETRAYEGVFTKLAAQSPAEWRRRFHNSSLYNDYVRRRQA